MGGSMYVEEKKLKAIREAKATFAIDKLVVTSKAVFDVLTQVKSVSTNVQLRRTLYGKKSR